MKAQFKSSKGIEDTKTRSEKGPRTEELVDLFKITPKQWVTIRLVGPVASRGIHWIPVNVSEAEEFKRNQDKQGKGGGGSSKGRPKSFPQVCLSYDPETEELDSTKECPWCAGGGDHIRLSTNYFQNVIVRELQEDEPKKKGTPTKKEEKTGFKEKGSSAWTPVRVFELNAGLVSELKKLAALNRHKDKKTGERKAYGLGHEKYGRDIMVMFDPDEKSPAKRWSVQLGDNSRLTDDEQEYLVWDVFALEPPKSKDEAKTEYSRWAKRNNLDKAKSKHHDDDDDDDDDLDDDSDDIEDDDDEDDSPKKKKGKPTKGKSKKSKRSDDDDDDDDDDDLDDDEDEDEDDDLDDDEPKVNKSAKDKKSKAKSDDGDDEDLDDDDDEDEKPAKKGKRAKSKKTSRNVEEDEDDEDSDDEDSDDEDDEDEPKSKAKSKTKRTSEDDEDDEDDDDDDGDLDDDLDDDDEDEKPAKKLKKSKGKKSALIATLK